MEDKLHTFEFRARVVTEALRGDRTIEEIADYFSIQPDQVKSWKLQAVDALSAMLHIFLAFSNGVDEQRGEPGVTSRCGLHAFVSG